MNITCSSWTNGPPQEMMLRTFRDFDVSWAGHCPLNGGFCFGSEDGRFLITNEDGSDSQGMKDSIVPSREAVNGLAFSGAHIAISTHAEVVFVTVQSTDGKGSRAVLNRGAHGVLSTPSGICIAPLGCAGLMLVNPSQGEHQPVTISRAGDEIFNFYKASCIPGLQAEIVACATRLRGVAAINLSQVRNDRRIITFGYQGLDVVDVCPLGAHLSTPAVAAVGKDGTIVLSRSVFDDKQPITLKFDDIAGVAYRVLTIKGHLVLLTSSGVYLLVGLAQRFLEGEDVVRQQTSVRGMLVEAVDINIAGDRWILVVMPNGVMLVDLASLLLEERLSETHVWPHEVSPPRWEHHEVRSAISEERFASVA